MASEAERTLPYGRQLIDDDDIAEVVRVLRSDFLTTGPEVEAFERALAAECGVAHAVAVANGTAALHCAYAGLGLSPDDEVVLPPLTFSATANMVLALGARPVFADIDPDTLCLDAAAVERALTPRTRGIATVAFAGLPSVSPALRALARRHGLFLLEDAAHALGGRVDGQPVGGQADVTTFSFHPVKTITTGEGGAVVTNDPRVAQVARDFRNHGLIRERDRLGRDDGPWYYEIQSLGLNYRLTAFQCALGRSQLGKLARFTARRAELVAAYRAAFADEPRLRLQHAGPEAAPAWHLFTVRLRDEATRARVFDGLARRGIAAQVHYVAVNDFPLYRRLGHDRLATPHAHEAARTLLSLPLYPAMTDADHARVVRAVRAALDDA